MITLPTALWGFVLPGILMAAALVIFCRRWGANRGAIAGFIFCGGFALAYWKMIITPQTPGADAKDWLFYFTIPLAIFAIFDGCLRPAMWVRAIILILMLRLAMRLLLLHQIPHGIAPAIAEMWIDLIALVGLAWWGSLEALAMRVPGVTVPLILWLLCAGGALMLVTFLSIQNAQLAGSLALMAFVAGMVACFRRGLSLAHGGVMPVTFLLLMLLVHGYFFSTASDHVRPGDIVLQGLLLISPLLAWAGDLPGVRGWRSGKRLTVRLIAVGLALAIAGGMSLKNHPVEQPNSPSMEDE